VTALQRPHPDPRAHPDDALPDGFVENTLHELIAAFARAA
jgi:hypothetical protein